ncbi:MAG: hypothetical protein R2739_11195 [Chitinophagales bacterium]|nr:hypothetical protein [Bacteroidota bacterium]
MKIIFSILIICFLLPIQIKALDNSISTITSISKNEFDNIKNPIIGQIVLVKEDATLYYYNGKNWLRLKGECFPEPSSPKIDSIILSGNNTLFYFNDENKTTQQYLIKNLDSNNEYLVKESPAKINLNLKKGVYNFTILGKNECGLSGPRSSKNIVIIEEQK